MRWLSWVSWSRVQEVPHLPSFIQTPQIVPLNWHLLSWTLRANSWICCSCAALIPLGLARYLILHEREGDSRTCVTVRCLSTPHAQTSSFSPSRNPPFSVPPSLKIPQNCSTLCTVGSLSFFIGKCLLHTAPPKKKTINNKVPPPFPTLKINLPRVASDLISRSPNGFYACANSEKTGMLQAYIRGLTEGWFSKRVVLEDVPPERKPERG